MGAGTVGLVLPSVASGEDRSRRRGTGTGTGTVTVPGNTGANGKVVVVGGGMAGATAAKYLRLWGGTGVQVTLIERNPQYTACILSNLVLNGSRSLTKQVFGYGPLMQNYGVNVVNADVTGIDMTGHKVSIGNNINFSYDKLVLAPGIEFDPIPMTGSATDQAKILHAWKAGAQTVALRDQIRAMPIGGVFVITIPLAPFRATAAPYDRACVVADYVLHNKPGSKVIILDANASIQGEPVNFGNAFNGIYAGIIEYHPNVTVTGIDATNLIVHTNLGDVDADVINAIPPQRGGAIIALAGLNNANGGRRAGVNVLTYGSTVPAVQDVHILGDSASAAPQPMGGHVGNAMAKVCADAITRMLRGDAPDPAPVTNSTVFSPISADTASWLSVVYGYDPVSKTMKPVGGAATEAAGATQKNFERMQSWFSNLMADTFA
jgi:NADPH-dependent 2,4-dienoyl-CoA reductase/sulfur reductase-like enzyme